MNNRTPYEILGLPETATRDQLKEAYKKAVLDNHPDKIKLATPNANDEELNQLTQEAAERFKEICVAYHSILNRLAEENQEAESIHTQDHTPVFDIAPDAIVTEDARIPVYLPIFVSGTYTAILSINITMSALDQPSRFISLREKINASLAKEKFQVGIDHQEAQDIIDQHSWYKLKFLIFVGWVQISLPLYHLESRSAESDIRTDPYFWIKKDSQIELTDIVAFHFPTMDNIYYWNRTDYIEALANQSKNGILNNATASQDLLNIASATQNLFDWNTGVTLTPEGISAALSAYQSELEHIAKYHSQIPKILKETQALAQLYHDPVISIEEKLKRLQSLRIPFLQQSHTGPFDILKKTIREYYQNQLAPIPATPVAESTPAPSTTSNRPLQENTAPAPINTAGFFSPESSAQITAISPKMLQLTDFLSTEISRIQNNNQATSSSNGQLLLGWISGSSTQSSTTHSAENQNRSQVKLNLLNALHAWLKTAALSDENKIQSVILLAHSLCALKQSSDPRKTKSQEKIEALFSITSDPLLSKEEIDVAKFPSNINLLLEIIEKKQVSETSHCIIQ